MQVKARQRRNKDGRTADWLADSNPDGSRGSSRVPLPVPGLNREAVLELPQLQGTTVQGVAGAIAALARRGGRRKAGEEVEE